MSEIKEGAKIAIPSDPTNEGRALQLLEEIGLIQLRDTCQTYPTLLDIADNPLCLKIQEIDAAFLPRVLEDVTCAVIPSNFALQGHVLPNHRALAIESLESPYANIVVIRKDDQQASLQVLKKHLTSKKVHDFIQQRYQGVLVPVFEPTQD